MLGAIFRIEKVDYSQRQQIWTVHLLLCNQDSFELKDLMSQMKKEVGDDITSFGWLLHRQGEFHKATKYFQQLLNEPSLSDWDRSVCFRGLGGIALKLKEYDEGLVYYHKALQLFKKLGALEPIGISYMRIGEGHFWKNELDLAISYQQKALIILPSDHPHLTDIYRQMANIYSGKNKFDLAIEYYEKSLNIGMKDLPASHVHFGVTYRNMGTTYHKKGDGKKALECYNKARNIWSKSLPLNHPDIKLLENDIRLVEELKD
ncbi:unnamed protein product [Didymodactylos carnosus]|uniref:Tetratricopeptide repeat protein n=1 Tax=Didymodactylos carnosus TaxID=1234261 RepID=A0A816BCX7_9BILA|nr:unnamed protein product [Didymodactylos carnosus]CAF4492307.1 unnamed protein product [Didymodactylos carnosus]